MHEKLCRIWNYRNNHDGDRACARRRRHRCADRSDDGRSDGAEASGYHVIVNRTGAAPLSQCSVSGVRPGQTHSTADSRGGSSINTTITSKTVYVEVAC
jgi:hypothetical protein